MCPSGSHEAAVVGGAVLFPRPGLAVVGRPRRDRLLIERIYLRLARRHEANVRTVADGGGLAIDRLLYPKLGKLLAERDGAGVLHEPARADGLQHALVERDRLVELVGADGDVGHDAGNVHGVCSRIHATRTQTSVRRSAGGVSVGLLR